MVVIAIFSVFSIVFALVLNDFVRRAEQNVQVLETFRRLTEVAEKVIQLLNKASGPANTVKILSDTQIQFDIIVLGRKISCRVTADNENHQLIYIEEDQPQAIPLGNVDVRFYSGSSSTEIDLPIKIIVTTQNPINLSSTMSLEFLVHPPGVR